MFLNLVYTLCISAFAVFFFMPWILRQCHKHGLYDIPNARKVHHTCIPRLGGVVFVPASIIGATIGLMIASATDAFYDSIKISTLLIGLGFMLVFLIGVLDDIFRLSAKLKFVVQFFAALVFPLNNLYIDNLNGLFGIYEINVWASYVLTILVVMFVVNAMNTIDGIDGLSSGLALIALMVYTYFFSQLGNYIFCFISCALMGALIAFMRFNLGGKVENGTKTFMGDCGSLTLGFSLSYLGLKLCASNAVLPPPEEGILIPISVLFVPSFDLIRVAVGRISRGVHPFSPDKTHIHHLLMQRGASQHKALLYILLMDVIVILMNFSLWYLYMNLTIIFVSDILLYLLLIAILKRERR